MLKRYRLARANYPGKDRQLPKEEDSPPLAAGARRHYLWLGHGGPMTASGIAQRIEARAAEAGIAGLHPHRLRATWAAHKLAAGVSVDTLRRAAGWAENSPMPYYYAAGNLDARTREAHETTSLADALAERKRERRGKRGPS